MTYCDSFAVANCDGCGLCNKIKLFSQIPEDREIIVISQVPSDRDTVLAEFHSGNGGMILKPLLVDFKVAYINATLCSPIMTEAETKDLAACRKRFHADLLHAIMVNPELKGILVFGAKAHTEFKKFFNSKMVKDACEDKKVADMIDCARESVKVHFSPNYVSMNSHITNKWRSEVTNDLRGFKADDSFEQMVMSTFLEFKFTLADRAEFMSEFKSSLVVGVDTETSDKDWLFLSKFKIGTVQIACDSHVWFFDYRNRDIKQCDIMKEAMGFSENLKVFANCLYDVTALNNIDIEVANYTDVGPLEFNHDNLFQEYNLEAIGQRHFPMIGKYKSKFKKNLVDNNFLGMPTPDLIVYSCMDAWMAKNCFLKLREEITPKILDLFTKVDQQSFQPLVDIRRSGMKFDADLFADYKLAFQKRYDELCTILKNDHKLDNINSVPQVKDWFYSKDRLNLKPIRWTDPKTKLSPSTDKDVIAHYQMKYPAVGLLYEARRIASMFSYFFPSFDKAIDERGYIHPNYRHYGIQTHRLSCSAPNLQGIPRDKTKIKVIDDHPMRKLFMARGDNFYIIESDFSQQEVRLIADLSRDPGLIAAYKAGKDIHRYIASILFEKKEEDVTDFERQVSKSCVFGAIFGSSAVEMAFKLGITDREAQNFLDKFAKLFPNVQSYLESQHEKVLRLGFITNCLGRRRKFLINNKNRATINETKREAGNFTIQSMGAEITKLCLVRARKIFIERGVWRTKVFMIHTVHDSIMSDVHKDYLKEYVEVMNQVMSGVPADMGFKVPFIADHKIGKRWGAQDVDVEKLLANELVAA